MTAKVHLRARPANEGARQLARWIMREFGGDILRAVAALPGWTERMLERLIDGEVVPGSEMIEPLARRAAIEPRAWRRAAAGGWFDVEPAAVRA